MKFNRRAAPREQRLFERVAMPGAAERTGRRRARRSRRTLAAVSAAAAVLAMAAIGYAVSAVATAGHRSNGPTAGNIALSRIPAVPPVTQRRNHGCIVPGYRLDFGGTDAPLPTVNTATTGAIVIWLPGLNSTTCRARLTRLSAGPAQALAYKINAAPKFPTGEMSCPEYDETAIEVYFRVPSAPPGDGQLVVIQPTGCPAIAAAHRYARVLKAGTLAGLRPTAPPAWRSYLASGW